MMSMPKWEHWIQANQWLKDEREQGFWHAVGDYLARPAAWVCRSERVRNGAPCLPRWWPQLDLDMYVSRRLSERLNNCVYGEFWTEYAASNLGQAVYHHAGCEEDTLIYWGFLPEGFEALDKQLSWKVSWPLMRRGSMDEISECPIDMDLEHPDIFDAEPAIILYRTLLPDRYAWRLDLFMRGASPEGLAKDWTYVAKLLRQQYRHERAKRVLEEQRRRWGTLDQHHKGGP